MVPREQQLAFAGMSDGPTTNVDDPVEPSDYDQERQRNIEANNKRLRELGLHRPAMVSGAV